MAAQPFGLQLAALVWFPPLTAFITNASSTLSRAGLNGMRFSNAL